MSDRTVHPEGPVQPTPTLIQFDVQELRTPTERRRFLHRLAIASGALALAPTILRPVLGGRSLFAQQGEGETEDLTDTDILNYALTLEYLEATFYLRADSGGILPGGATVTQIDPDGNGAPGTVPGLASVSPPAPATFDVPAFVREVRDHEITHVQALQTALGASALARNAFAFDFPGAFDSAQAFLTTAQALEDTGVTAYLGQVNNIDSTAILATAGSIAGVEGEHASVFRFLNGVSISPSAFDQPRTSAEVLAIADDFITQAPTLPFP